MKKSYSLFVALCVSALISSACTSEKEVKKKLYEVDYQTFWCEQQDGEAEVRLSDKTRCDCILDTYAVEVDFAKKWAEAIGQSMHYARLTGKEAGILLISNSKSDHKNYLKLMDNIKYYDLPIKVWRIKKEDLQL